MAGIRRKQDRARESGQEQKPGLLVEGGGLLKTKGILRSGERQAQVGDKYIFNDHFQLLNLMPSPPPQQRSGRKLRCLERMHSAHAQELHYRTLVLLLLPSGTPGRDGSSLGFSLPFPVLDPPPAAIALQDRSEDHEVDRDGNVSAQRPRAPRPPSWAPSSSPPGVSTARPPPGPE